MLRKYLSLFALLIFVSLSSQAQSNTIANFEKNSTGYKVFLYQSVIRMLNPDQNPDFNKLIKDLDHLRLLSNEPDGETGRTTFASLDQGIKGEGFEMIMSVDNKDKKFHVYELASNKGKTTWVVTFLMDERAGIMEMKGTLDFKYINSLKNLDYSKIEQVIPAASKSWD